MPQPECNLLNGTQKIGIMDVSENCNLKAAEQALECQWGTLESVQNISDLPLQWTAGKKTCEAGEGCQDTLMIMENGEKGPSVQRPPSSYSVPPQTSSVETVEPSFQIPIALSLPSAANPSVPSPLLPTCHPSQDAQPPFK
jgi:hypothetical protein